MSHLFLSEIWIYPIKSLGGISLSSSPVFQKGLEFDRRLMLVDEKGVFLTQRTLHKLALFKTSIRNERIHVSYLTNSISFNIRQDETESVPVTVWTSEVSGCEVSTEISSWFSEMLGLKCRLIFFPEDNPRKVEDPYSENVSLADAFPVLTIGQSSLDDLNNRIGTGSPIPMNRFRPNLVVSGEVPYLEDSWKKFTMGQVQFLGTRRSYRCIVTTIDQDTGEKGREPLLTLSKYRKEDSKIFFGLNTLVLNEGKIQVGDTIRLQG